MYDAGADTMKPTERYHVVYDRPTAEVNVSVSAIWDFADPPQPKDENDPDDPAVLAHKQLMSRRGEPPNSTSASGRRRAAPFSPQPSFRH